MLFTPDWRALTCTVRSTWAPNSEKFYAPPYQTPYISCGDIGYVRLELTKLQKFPSGRPERAKNFGESPRIPIINYK